MSKEYFNHFAFLILRDKKKKKVYILIQLTESPTV